MIQLYKYVFGGMVLLLSVVYPFKINSMVGYLYLIDLAAICFMVNFINLDLLPGRKLKILKALLFALPFLGICYAIVIVATLPNQLPMAVVFALAINIFCIILSLNLIYVWKKYGFDYVLQQIQQFINAE